MEIFLIPLIIIVFAALVAAVSMIMDKGKPASVPQKYFYSRKNDIMTNAEWRFFERLNAVAAGKYHVFPQIHLSSLLKNETKGKYYKLAFQRINRRSVDFVLCDIGTHKPVYAVELDDWSHDSAKRQARDGVVEEMLGQVGLPLVRFRNVEKMSDEDITNKFREASYAANGNSSIR